MTGLPLILDAAGLSALSQKQPPTQLRALMQMAMERGREVLAPTVVCAEVARGRDRTRALEAAVIYDDRPGGSRPAVRPVDTDFVLARQVGAILHAAGRGSADLAGAHVVAVSVGAGGGLVVTSDPDDILALAATGAGNQAPGDASLSRGNRRAPLPPEAGPVLDRRSG